MIAVMLARLLFSVLVLCGSFGPSAAIAASKRDQSAQPTAPSTPHDQAACRAMLRSPARSQLRDWVDGHRDEVAALITPDSREQFDGHIRADRCEVADAMIRERFRRNFPEMQCLFDREIVWHIYVSSEVFPDYRLCVGEQEIRSTRAVFQDSGVEPPVADPERSPERATREFGDLGPDVAELDRAVLGVVLTCLHQRYQPACLAHAQLANRGVTYLPDDEILFLLIRARLAGHETPESSQLEAEIAARLDAGAPARAEVRARKSLAEWGVAIVGADPVPDVAELDPAPAPDTRALCWALAQAPPGQPLYDWVAVHRDAVAALITPDQRPLFDQSIAARHCEAAEAILKLRFKAAFPDLACFFETDQDTTRSFPTWRGFVATWAYPDLDLCFGEVELAAVRAFFTEKGMTPPAAQIGRSQEAERAFGDLRQAIFDLDYAAIDIVSGCLESLYQPSCVAYARLAAEGIIQETDEEILFYLVRARLAGYETPELAPLEAEVAARLNVDVLAETEARARRNLTEKWGIAVADD